ncbi:heavy metal transporter [Trueperella bernardiae]|uniref:Mercuric reductase n=1 Tax=Trueperella bernardiae TaxID=59561 RepID=A0A0W1KJ19_9ACTO|nr:MULTISPECIES: cation transporter [Trueperella]KTF03532.1 Mercuric reductase [Trueperella bernardiae]MDV6239122.1 cation transporter [Trueperella bernardiae]OCW60200.1 heavy metal transporter [Trueperella bernardiae]OFS66932.1 heavy metal transporter [Trueperella sp. HMSC08H06]PKZ88596.1 heavy metal transporter [Trueperella bernardiae]
MSTTVKVNGMTCNHCVAHVTEELMELPGVDAVDVTLDPKGTSEVRVTTSAEVSDEALRGAVDEAGNYSVVEIVRS